MRHALANLLLASMLGGCSLVYNPSNIPTPDPDASVDAYVADADPSMLELLDVAPRVLLEGQGDGESRRAVLTISGRNIVRRATVRLVPPDGEAVVLTVHDDEVTVAANGEALAVPVTIPVDLERAAGDVPLSIEITQDETTRTLADALVLRSLPELEEVVTDSTQLAPLYSKVEIAEGDLVFPAAQAPPVLIRSVTSISIAGTISANASGSVPGPGGYAGGEGSHGKGTGGGRAGTGGRGGGGGGHAAAGGNGSGGLAPGGGQGGPAIGSAQIASYATNHGSGGGGSAGSGAGGGGGGIIELTAGGRVDAGSLSARAAAGSGGGLGANGGGGGAGGVIVVRAGTIANIAGTVDTSGAGGMNGGGAGTNGRTRIDAPMVMGPASAVESSVHRGASFEPDSPLIVTDRMPTLVVTGTPSDNATVFVLDARGVQTHAMSLVIGTQTVSVTPTLGFGYNRVCISPMGSTPDIVESTNCLEIAWIP